MINFIYKILGKCRHDYEDWEPTSVVKNGYGKVRIIQMRVCKKCSYSNFKSTVV